MRTIYLGLASSDGYFFVTNDTFGVTEDEGAIVEVNKLCGAFIVTTRRNISIRVRGILDKCIPNLNSGGEGLSMDLATAIVRSFKMESEKELCSKENPLPFLLLLVGYNLKQPAYLEHIFVRNRVVRVMEKSEKREYITDFEIQPPVPARNLFYGHSELSQYLSQQLPSDELDLETMKLFAYFSIIETQQIDNSLSPDIRMAILSKDNRFEWITSEEIQRLSNMSKRVAVKLSKGLLGCFNSGKGGWNC